MIRCVDSVVQFSLVASRSTQGGKGLALRALRNLRWTDSGNKAIAYLFIVAVVCASFECQINTSGSISLSCWKLIANNLSAEIYFIWW